MDIPAHHSSSLLYISLAIQGQSPGAVSSPPAMLADRPLFIPHMKIFCLSLVIDFTSSSPLPSPSSSPSPSEAESRQLLSPLLIAAKQSGYINKRASAQAAALTTRSKANNDSMFTGNCHKVSRLDYTACLLLMLFNAIPSNVPLNVQQGKVWPICGFCKYNKHVMSNNIHQER